MTPQLSILLATCPAQGHVQPLLPLATALINAGHHVRWIAGRKFENTIYATGAQWIPLPKSVDFDDEHLDEEFPERRGLRGLALARHDLRMFIDAIPAQHAAITDAINDHPVDVIIPDQMFLGALPLLNRQPSTRPKVLVAGISPITISGGDVPMGGAMPMRGPLGQWRNALIRAGFTLAFSSLQHAAQQHFSTAGGQLTRPWIEAARDADAILQLSVTGLEYPLLWLETPIHYVGPLTRSDPSQFPLPPWWQDLDPLVPLVLVTQGTVANHDLAQLVLPTIQALAHEPVTTVVTLSGGDQQQLGSLPTNVRVADYLPFDVVLPRCIAMVSNGGYGGVNLALRHGVPLVLSGATEDKAEVSRRIRWAGVGVTTRHHPPTPADIRRAVHRIVNDKTIGERAKKLARQYANADGVSGAVKSVERLAMNG